MNEKRLTSRMKTYWEHIRHGQEIPNIESFNPETIIDILPKCLLISVHPSPQKTAYIYQYVGEDLVKIFGQNPTGYQVLPHMPHQPTAQLIAEMDKALTSHQPLFLDSQFISKEDIIVKYRACLLPFGHDKRITHFLATLSWQDNE